MGLFAIIGAAVAAQYINDTAKHEVTAKPLIGAGIVLIILTAISDGVSPKLATIMAWIILLAVLFNDHEEVGKFFASLGNPA